jgi:hypothetical protein
MNAVGKIFVVLIFTTSIILMCSVSLVYVAHTSWQQKAMDLEETNATLKQELADLQEDKDTMEGDLWEEIARREAEVGLLTSDLATKTQQNKDTQSENARLSTELNGQIATIDAAERTLENYRNEITDLLSELDIARNNRTETFADVVEKTDQLHALQLQFDALQERENGLLQQLADARTVLDLLGEKPIPSLYTGVAPRVEGVVLAVRPTGLIEISIGEDDGLQPGHSLEVYRMNDEDGVYLGRVQVSHIEPDKAVCTILPQFRKGMMQRGDSVASKLQ